jgi:CBS domain-containing protein
MLTVRDLMQTEVVTISPEATVRELARLLADTGISGVPVVGPGGTVLGVVSSSDVVRLAAEGRENGLIRHDARWSPRIASGEPDQRRDLWTNCRCPIS